MAYNGVPVQPELATASIAEATSFYIGLALANSALRIALSVASILGTATTSAACTHAEGLPTTAVTGAEPTVSPTTINSTVPESAAPTKGGDQTPQEAKHFAVYPVTLNATGFGPVTKSAKQMKADLSAAWTDLAEKADGALPKEVDIEVKPAQKITIDGITSVKDFCDGKDPQFRDHLREAVVPQHGGPETEVVESIIVLNQKVWLCGTADAGVGVDQVYYDQDYFTQYGTEHETAHTLGIGHSNMLTNCNPPKQSVGLDCVDLEYGDNTTIMGGYRYSLGDVDPLSGYALMNLGAIPPSEVLPLDTGKTIVYLSPVSDRSPNGVRLARVDTDPVEISIQNGDQGPVSTATINRVFFELSTVYTDGNKDRSLAVKVYGVDSALSKYSLPKTYLIPCAGSYLFGKDASFGQMCYFHIGTTRIGFTLQTLSQTGPGGAEVLVDVARLPEPDYVFGV